MKIKVGLLMLCLVCVSCNRVTKNDLEHILDIQLPKYKVIEQEKDFNHIKGEHSVYMKLKFNEKNADILQKNLDNNIENTTIESMPYGGYWTKKDENTYSFYYALECLIIHAKYDISTRILIFEHGKICGSVVDKGMNL